MRFRFAWIMSRVLFVLGWISVLFGVILTLVLLFGGSDTIDLTQFVLFAAAIPLGVALVVYAEQIKIMIANENNTHVIGKLLKESMTEEQSSYFN